MKWYSVQKIENKYICQAIFVRIKTSAEACNLPSAVCMNDLPQMGNSSDLAQCGPIKHVCPFSGLSLESKVGSMTHFPATTCFFSQQILLILIFGRCVLPYSLCWISNAFFLLCVCLCKVLISPRKTHITPFSLSSPLVIIPWGF